MLNVRKWLPAAAFAATLAGMLAMPARADEPKPADPPADVSTDELAGGGIPESVKDAGFGKYIDLTTLAQALADQDAGLVLDAALQLAEGERVLLRSHKGLKAATLFDLSAKFAVANQDKDAFARLGKAAAALKMDDFGTRLKALEPALSKGRDAGPKFDLTALTPDELSTYQGYQKEIQRSKALGDKEDLEALKNGLPESELNDALRAQIGKDIAAALAATPAAKSAEELETLRALAGAGRDSNKGDVQNSVRSGGWTVAFGKEVDAIEYAKLIASMVTGTVGAYLADLVRDSARTLGMNVVIQAIKNRGKTFGAGQFVCAAGIATYNNWKYVKLFGVKKKISLPNSHQPYVKWKRK